MAKRATSLFMTAVGIFGGSFNPPHLGHQVLMLLALESKEVDKILMIPTFKHAFDKELAPFEDLSLIHI